MNCYTCNQRHPGGTSFGVAPAIGICQQCGVAVCAEHSVKATAPDSPLLCRECARLEAAIPQNDQAR